MAQDTISLRVQDLLHRVRRAIAGSQSTIDPPFGDSPNLPDIYYVDSSNGADGNDGRDPGFPMATIDAAINRCTASQGDVILVQPGHSEIITTGIALDVIGVSIIGIGEGTLRPQLTLNEDNGDCISITAVNCRVENLQFNEAVDNITGEQTGSDINIAAAYATVAKCHFDAGIYDTEQITITADGDYAVVEGCEFHVTADGPDAGIEIEGTVTGIQILRNYFNGLSVANAWDVGAINSGQVHTLCVIDDNTINFCAASTGGIQFTAASTGVIKYNTLTNGTLTQMLDPGSCHCIQNFEQDDIDESGVLFPPVNAAGTVGGGAHGGIDSATTDSLHGKLGTHSEMVDRSLWDLLEGDGFNSWPTAAPYANDVSLAEVLAYIQDGIRRGSGTINPADVSLYDLIGGAKGHPAWPTAAAYTNDVSLMEVVGYIQDAVRRGTGTILGADESLADVLYATKGIVGSFPAGAAPTGTGVSLAQAIRYISESLRTTTGAFIPGMGLAVIRAADQLIHDGDTTSVFTIATGRVLITALVAEVAGANLQGGASNLRFISNPTTGATENMCADLDVDGDPEGTQYSIDGVAATALLRGEAGHVLVMPNAGRGQLLNEGTIQAVSSVDRTTGGSTIQVTIYYIPIDSGATVAAA